jgi:hypothetical protein
MVPQCHPVVEPDRQMDAPVAASWEPLTVTSGLEYPSTSGRGVLPDATCTQA